VGSSHDVVSHLSLVSSLDSYTDTERNRVEIILEHTIMLQGRKWSIYCSLSSITAVSRAPWTRLTSTGDYPNFSLCDARHQKHQSW
jgi:hypothetical protein